MRKIRTRTGRQNRRQAAKKRPTRATSVPTAKKSDQERYTVAQVVQAVTQARGMVAAAARSLGCIRQTIYDYRDRHPEVREALEESKEMQLDVTELKLFVAIDKGEAWAVCFYLKTQGRQRGYIERHDMNVKAKVSGGVLLLNPPVQSEEEWEKETAHSGTPSAQVPA